jgi:hypothetical protein
MRTPNSESPRHSRSLRRSSSQTVKDLVVGYGPCRGRRERALKACAAVRLRSLGAQRVDVDALPRLGRLFGGLFAVYVGSYCGRTSSR